MENRVLIFLTDVESRKSFDIFNCLKTRYDFTFFSSQNWLVRIFLSLIYFKKVHPLGKGKNKVIQAFAKHAHSKDTEIIYLPVEEKTTEIVIESLNDIRELIPNFKALLPPLESFKTCQNKIEFSKYCNLKGFPIPTTYSLSNKTDLKLLEYPLIAKPSIGSGSVGIQFIDNHNQFPSEILREKNNWLIQSRLKETREVHGAFFLMKDGDCISYYGHKRLRTFPKKGGVSTFCVLSNDDHLKEIGIKILKSMRWNGFAMIEFIFDEQSEDYKIIEINPRLWGSVLLSEFSGSGFLDMYILECIGRNTPASSITKISFLRWLFPHEFVALIKREISVQEFFKIMKDPVCYINLTYANPFSAILFQIFLIGFNLGKVRLLK